MWRERIIWPPSVSSAEVTAISSPSSPSTSLRVSRRIMRFGQRISAITRPLMRCSQALSQVVGQFAYSGAGFIGIGGVMEAHAGVLALRRLVGHNEAAIQTIRNLEKPATKLTQAAAQPFFSQRGNLGKSRDAKILELRHHLRDRHRIDLLASALDFGWARGMAILFAQLWQGIGQARASRTHLQQHRERQGLHKRGFAARWNI